MKQIQGKQGLVRDIGRFGKPRVREIGIPLYNQISLPEAINGKKIVTVQSVVLI